MQNAKEAGFEINMFYVGLNHVELNIQRVVARVKQGGHNIEEADIRRRQNQSIENLIKALGIIDKAVIIDNSFDQGRTIMEIENGLIVYQVNDIPLFGLRIRSSLEQ